MTHLSLEEFNIMMAGKATSAERADWADHIIECTTCAQRFKALHQLHQEAAPSRKQYKPLRWAVGVAAVMFMSIYPYLTAPQKAEPLQVAGIETTQTHQQAGSLALLERIDQVNYRNALQDWGTGKTDLTALIKAKSSR